MHKVIYIGLLVAVFIATIFGGIKRKTYTDLTSTEDWTDTCYVAQLHPDVAASAIAQLEESLETYDCVLKVQKSGAFKPVFFAGTQEVEVMEVVKGDQALKGEQILLTSKKWKVRVQEDGNYLSRGFVNFMQDDIEYLVYLSQEIDTSLVEIPVFEIGVTDSFIIPMFASCDVAEHVIAEDAVPDSTYVKYSEVKGNEFFIEDMDTLEQLLDLKARLLVDYTEF